MLTVVGIKRGIKGTNKKTGEPYEGLNLFCTNDRSDVDGLGVETLYISSKASFFDYANKLAPGTSIYVSYNRWGNIESLSVKGDK